MGMKNFGKFFIWLASLGLLCTILGFFLVIGVISYYSQDLPDYEQLKDYRPPIVTRIHAGDGRLLTEYSREKRVFVPIEFIPERVKNAFIAAEDKTFYSHHGLDYMGIVGAAIRNVQNLGTGRPLIGASTITQQVAKNFLLTNEQKLERKIREALLALKMEKAMSKDTLLELYLNEIYLGSRSYGVGAAAQEYYNKALPELDIHEVAYLASLPKAPSRLQIDKNPEMALERRNWVIEQMAENGFISDSEAEIAKMKPLDRVNVVSDISVSAAYFSEEVRRELQKSYGEDILYYGGLSVRTTLDPDLQKIATKTLRDGLLAYERRHGYPGRVKRLGNLSNWNEELQKIQRQAGMPLHWKYAVVLNNSGAIGVDGGEKSKLHGDDWAWVQGDIPPRSVIMVSDEDKEGVYRLKWVPRIQGGLVALDPHTGRILAMQGGWSTEISSFNRVTQAKRQPGSAFKPFVYLTALENGFTPATLILDAPFVIDQGPGLKKWRPQNYSKEFYGPTPLRMGVEKSRNLMTVRLAEYVGMEKIAEVADRFGITKDLPQYLSQALGAGETTLLDISAAYGMLVNGGKRIHPTMIDRIQDRYGKTIEKHDKRQCRGCGNRIAWNPMIKVPEVPDTREQVADPKRAYQIVSILEGVTKRGTATRVGQLPFPVAGKTGTTNDSKDAWFIGFTPDLVVGVYIGYDDPRPLGRRETGSSAAAPIFKDFMADAMKDETPQPFRTPPGIRLVQINAETGTRAQPGDERVIWEAFVPGEEPNDDIFILDANGISQIPAANFVRDGVTDNPGLSTRTGTGGIY